MSRLAKNPIEIPQGVTASFDGHTLTITGPKGTLTRAFRPIIDIKIVDNTVHLEMKKNDVATRSLWGTYGSHIANMLYGVVSGYEKKLILEGVGFRWSVNGNAIDMSLGFSHPVKMIIPEGLQVVIEKNTATITGTDKESVGRFAADVRAKKKPEPYKGKGIRYSDEVIRRKQGKKSA
jgi:large subunit ribosomal protein L6